MPDFSDQKSVILFSFFPRSHLCSLINLNNTTLKNLCTDTVFGTHTHTHTHTHTAVLVTRCMDFLGGIWGNTEAVDW